MSGHAVWHDRARPEQDAFIDGNRIGSRKSRSGPSRIPALVEHQSVSIFQDVDSLQDQRRIAALVEVSMSTCGEASSPFDPGLVCRQNDHSSSPGTEPNLPHDVKAVPIGFYSEIRDEKVRLEISTQADGFFGFVCRTDNGQSSPPLKQGLQAAGRQRTPVCNNGSMGQAHRALWAVKRRARQAIKSWSPVRQTVHDRSDLRCRPGCPADADSPGSGRSDRSAVRSPGRFANLSAPSGRRARYCARS